MEKPQCGGKRLGLTCFCCGYILLLSYTAVGPACGTQVPEETEEVEDEVQEAVEVETEEEKLCLEQGNWKISNDTEADDDVGCSAIWDGINCWPAAKAGTTVWRPCTQVMEFLRGTHVEGDAFRVCSGNGTWMWEGYTNYSACIDVANELAEYDGNRKARVQQAVRYIVLTGSIISLASLGVTVHLLKKIRNMRTERLTLLLQIIMALILKSGLLLIITGPAIAPNIFDWNSKTWACNVVITTQIYASMVSNFWVVAHGQSLNKLVGEDGFGSKIPIQKAIGICWGVPVLPCTVWFLLMSYAFGNPRCWVGYEKSHIIWVITVPLLSTIAIHLLYIVRIVYALIRTIELSQFANWHRQKWTATKITVTLFLMMGINNIFFFYKPRGTGENLYLFVHAVFQSFQGAIISVIFCILTREIRRKILHCCRSAFDLSRLKFMGTATERLAKAAGVGS